VGLTRLAAAQLSLGTQREFAIASPHSGKSYALHTMSFMAFGSSPRINNEWPAAQLRCLRLLFL
jgi:hypothetical protein